MCANLYSLQDYGYDERYDSAKKHWQQIAHLNVKPDTIAVDETYRPYQHEGLRFMLTNFKYASFKPFNTWGGDMRWRGPEDSPSMKTDVFSLGAVISNLIFGDRFMYVTAHAFNFSDFDKRSISHYSEPLQELGGMCLKREVKDRINSVNLVRAVKKRRNAWKEWKSACNTRNDNVFKFEEVGEHGFRPVRAWKCTFEEWYHLPSKIKFDCTGDHIYFTT